MTVALALFVYAATMATWGAWLLRESAWPVRAPRLAIAAWQALAFTVLSSVLLGGVALATRFHLVSTHVADLIHVCMLNVRAGYGSPGRAATTTLAIAVLLAVSTRAVWGATITTQYAARQLRRQLQILELVARRDPQFDVLVLAHHAPAAFCFPGRGRSVVVTSSALDVLSPDELAAVIAHERAHLRGRHHLTVAIAQSLDCAFPGVPVFSWGQQQVRRLVELAADDLACRHHRRSCIASAILLLADAAPPAGTLALGSEAIHVRLRRLTEREAPLRRGLLNSLSGLIVVVLIAPAIVAALSALAAAGVDYC